MASCRSCGARVVWARTETKEGKPPKSMPLDATPDGRVLVVENGNIVTIGTDTGGAPVVRYVASGQGRHRSHFATCPHAAEHRKR